jgi:cytochrome d ubiquinol oxidase subunit I
VPVTRPPELKAAIEIPGLLSWLAFGDARAPVRGINEFPPENQPPLWVTFVAFHNMVILGLFFIAAMGWGVLQLLRGRLGEQRWFLGVLVWSIPLPIVACQLGWVAAEVGRQPWIVYGLLRTSDAASCTVPAGDILASLLLFSLIYLALGALWLFLMFREVHHGPEPVRAQEA